jgi:hypothetical protein
MMLVYWEWRTYQYLRWELLMKKHFVKGLFFGLGFMLVYHVFQVVIIVSSFALAGLMKALFGA